MSTNRAGEAGAYLLVAMAAFALWLLLDPLRNLTATTSSGRATLWVYTPHVAPGDNLEIEVQLRGGRRLGIEQVHVQAGKSYLERHGRGADWGSFIVGRRSSGGSDSVEISVPIPRDAVVGASLPISLDIDYVEAVSTGAGTFKNQSGTEALAVDVLVRSPHDRDIRRLLSALWAIGLLAAATIATLLVRYSLRASSTATRLAVYLLLLLVGGYVGYGWFALPLVAATRILSDVFAVVAVLAFLAIPILIVRLVGRRAAEMDHTARFEAVEAPTPPRVGEVVVRGMNEPDYPERMARDVPLATLVSSIAADVPVTRRGRGFAWIDRERRGRLEATVADAEYVKPRSVKIVATDRRMVLPVAEAMAKVYGPLEIIFNENQRVLVDGSMSAGDLLLVLEPKWAAVEAMADAMLGGKRTGRALPTAWARGKK